MEAVSSPTIRSPHVVEPTDGPITFDELKMAYRCPGMPLEALRFDRTPTGLHYQVVHFTIPDVDAGGWRLDIGGLVERKLDLSLSDLMARPAVTMPVTLECAGNGRALLDPRPVSGPWLAGGVSNAEWTGTPLAPLLDEAGVGDGAVDVVFSGADRGIQGGEEQDYARGLPLAEAVRPEVLLAYAMNGRPLEPQHGAPLRLLVPGWYGITSVKWLTSIEVIGQRYRVFQNEVAYRYQRAADDPGEPVTRMRVKSLMSPPGIPEFITERSIVESGPVRLSGRAWSGSAPIGRVQVGIDGLWLDADLRPSLGARAWRGWSFDWDATAGEHELSCRATDEAGDTQPLDQPWNFQGMGNNTVQRMTVSVS